MSFPEHNSSSGDIWFSDFGDNYFFIVLPPSSCVHIRKALFWSLNLYKWNHLIGIVFFCLILVLGNHSLSLLPKLSHCTAAQFIPSMWVQFSCSVVSDSATPWIAARQASLSITNSWSSLRLASIKSVMPSSRLWVGIGYFQFEVFVRSSAALTLLENTCSASMHCTFSVRDKCGNETGGMEICKLNFFVNVNLFSKRWCYLPSHQQGMRTALFHVVPNAWVSSGI